jgi:RNA polymerase sigma-70 factor (ECF subfamily)
VDSSLATKRATADSSRTELDDLTLARAKRGDKAAFRQLVIHYQRPVFALLSRLLAARGGQALVEDLAQETFVRVFRALGTFGDDGRNNLSGWILTIATRLALDELRKRPLCTESYERAMEILPGGPAADRAAEQTDLRNALERAVSQLPPAFRATFLLREVHGLEYEAIAEALNVDLGTVKSRLNRARTVLRAALTGIYHEI